MSKINILLAHDDFYIVDKPANHSFHSEQGAGFFATCSDQLSEQLYPVHRLDKVTSGILVLARNSVAARRFGEMFENKRDEKAIEKYYVAISDQKPKKKQGWVKGDMAKSRRGTYKLLKSNDNPAVTRFYSNSIRPGIRAYLLRPYSGKTHQLRVAMKSLSAPILGDMHYGGTASDRTYLHAFAINFDWRGERIALTCKPTFGEQFSTSDLNEQLLLWQHPHELDW